MHGECLSQFKAAWIEIGKTLCQHASLAEAPLKPGPVRVTVEQHAKAFHEQA